MTVTFIISHFIMDTKENKPITVSFGILDDLEFYPEYPIHKTIDSVDNLKQIIQTILDESADQFTSLYFRVNDKQKIEERFSTDLTADEIVDKLKRNGYYVLNRCQKYYVVAFALNFTRFEIYAKDCDKKLIDWKNELQTNAKVVHQIKNPEYNENPVVRVLKSLHK